MKALYTDAKMSRVRPDADKPGGIEMKCLMYADRTLVMQLQNFPAQHHRTEIKETAVAMLPKHISKLITVY